MKFWQIIVLILLVSIIGVGVSVWQPWKVSTKNITVTGEGKVKETPDVAQIQGGVESKKPTAKETSDEVTSKMSKIIELVKAEGIEEKDIKTTQISTNPNYNYADGKNSQDGYISNTTITITIRDIAKGQKVLDLLTNNGATNIYGPNLTFSDEKMETIKTAAREEAVKNAKKKADELAGVSGAKVGKVISISESNYYGGEPIPYLTMSAASDVAKSPSSTIQPGQNEVTLQVTVSYGLK